MAKEMITEKERKKLKRRLEKLKGEVKWVEKELEYIESSKIFHKGLERMRKMLWMMKELKRDRIEDEILVIESKLKE